MIVLSYDTAKKHLLILVLYLIAASLLIKGIGVFLNYNVIEVFSSISGNMDLSSLSNISLPEFNKDSLSFDWIIKAITEFIDGITAALIPASVAMAETTTAGTILTHKVIGLKTAKFIGTI